MTSFPAIYFDGRSAAEQRAEVTLDATSLTVSDPENETVLQTGRENLHRSASTEARLVITVIEEKEERRILVEKSAVLPFVWDALNQLPDRPASHAARPLPVLFAILAFIGACLATFSFLIPAASDRLAPLIPVGFERTLGHRLERIVLQADRHTVCASSATNEYLLTLSDQLQVASGRASAVSIHIIDLPLANAFALPSGQIYVTNGLLGLTRSSDELMAVLAHEMGHVQAHHALRLSLRIGGSSAVFGFLLGDFTGSAAVFAIGQALMGTAFSREFEREADELSVPIMRNLGVSPQMLAQMLARLENEQRPHNILATHPLTSERLDFLRQAGQTSNRAPSREGSTNRLAQGWNSLKLICG
jgi:predicted Zn-dependent protease